MRGGAVAYRVFRSSGCGRIAVYSVEGVRSHIGIVARGGVVAYRSFCSRGCGRIAGYSFEGVRSHFV